ncbi:hypothetical protein PBRA_003728 [Plasmodiophora brassicae]|uniref:Cyclic nucleotide-binding domain-containing protein n=1 Tax=Plasmodiophora brassicae TaxID=37360 RepID=A0A0G4IIJ8_PLABS|nr:hypothetical protein PBRA_003728 [Plasmodiophora brassicae]
MEALRLTRAYDVLKSMDMFKGVTKHNLEMFADMVHIRGVRAGETAVKEGDTGKSLYIVERGELEARSGNLVLSTIKPGQCFGEIAMMMQIPRTSTVVSTKACILYGTLLPQLFATDFDRFMQVDSVVHKYVASKTKDTIARQFRKYSKSFFDALSDEILDEVSKVSKVEVFQAGDCIFKEGDESDRFFMIADGAVSITSSKGVATKREKGSYFGEVGLMVKGDTKRKAAVTAVCRSLFLTIDRENFNRLFNRPDCLGKHSP